MNGKNAASVAQTTSSGSSIRRRASAKVQKISGEIEDAEDQQRDAGRGLQRLVLDVLDPEDRERGVHV